MLSRGFLGDIAIIGGYLPCAITGWEKGFDFQLLNGDYAGPSLTELARLYTEELGHGT